MTQPQDPNLKSKITVEDPLEKSTARHPYTIYIIGTVAFFVLILIIGYFGTQSDWVLKQR